jgi:hypothetical protein
MISKRSFDRYYYRPLSVVPSRSAKRVKGENQTNRWGYGFLKISYFFPVFSEKEDHKKKFHFRTYKNPYREKNGGL